MSESDVPRRRPVGEVLRELMRLRGEANQAEVARRAGLKQPTVWRIVNDRVKNPPIKTIQGLARAMRVSYGVMAGLEPIPDNYPNSERGATVSPSGAVPLLTDEAAARGVIVAKWPEKDVVRDIETFSEAGERAFAVKAQGHSMDNQGGRPSIPEGTIVVIDPDIKPEHGKIVWVRPTAKEAPILRVYSVEGDRVYLHPLNRRYDPLDGSKAVVLGVADRKAEEPLP